ncbi:hook-length control protein FliK [Nitrosomonas sp. Nm51]|nr:hook-length control protein FliK [Nitrosomonas sp. Nm51]
MIPATIKTDKITQETPLKAVTPVKPIAPVSQIATAVDYNTDANHFVQGQKYQAIVDGRLSNDNFNVLLSGRLLQMHLPHTTQPGDKIELTFLTHLPRLKFALRYENTSNTTKESTVISTTGRLLNSIIHETSKTNVSNSTVSTNSILTQTSLNSPQFPLLLQKTIRQSGLFYESHLAKWINGKNTLEEIKQEPQNKLVNAASPIASTMPSAVPTNAQSVSLVQQQLMALETNHIVWNGEIWNGQRVQWDIYGDNTSKSNETDRATSRWSTKLTLTLPKLGKIVVTLSLNFNDLHISVNAADNSTALLLKINQTPLKQSLLEKDLTMQSLKIDRHEQK